MSAIKNLSYAPCESSLPLALCAKKVSVPLSHGNVYCCPILLFCSLTTYRWCSSRITRWLPSAFSAYSEKPRMKELVIATKVNEPYLCECALGNLQTRANCQQPGVDAEIVHHVLTLGRIPCRLVPHSETPWGSEVNGSWSGFFGLLFNGSIGTVQIPTLL